VADAGCRAVVVGADASAPRVLDRRGDVLLSGPVPHGWLFPRVSVAVHHGGAGTTAAAFRAGLPMVTVPFFADQVFWGRVVNAIGAAPPPIPRRHLTSRRLAEAIVAATAGATMRARSRRLAQNITQGQGVNLAISALERAVGGAQPGAALAGSQ
jgi:sterol 3beta-glucosyltransferase